MAQPEDPHGRYREHIAAADQLLRQKESWADRAEWEVIQKPDGWEVVAWQMARTDVHAYPSKIPLTLGRDPLYKFCCPPVSLR
jgi:hypothetical protein